MKTTESGIGKNSVWVTSYDIEVKGILKDLAKDLLEHSYNPLIETLFSEFHNSSEMIQVTDVYRYIKFTAFFLSMFRR